MALTFDESLSKLPNNSHEIEKVNREKFEAHGYEFTGLMQKYGTAVYTAG